MNLIYVTRVNAKSNLDECQLSTLQMKRFQNTVGPSMINQSLPHVEFIVKKVDSLTKGEGKERLLRTLEAEDEEG